MHSLFYPIVCILNLPVRKYLYVHIYVIQFVHARLSPRAVSSFNNQNYIFVMFDPRKELADNGRLQLNRKSQYRVRVSIYVTYTLLHVCARYLDSRGGVGGVPRRSLPQPYTTYNLSPRTSIINSFPLSKRRSD